MRFGPLTGILLSALLPASAAAEAARPPAWDYIGGANDDEGWAELSPDYKACAGHSQSPVDIQTAEAAALPALQVRYRLSDAIAQLREQTLLVQFQPGNTLDMGGKEYQLKQLRVHTPAEHSIQGKTAMLELQLLHQAQDGALLLVAVLAEMGEAAHAGLTPLMDNLPDAGEREKKLRLDPTGLLPHAHGYYAYEGSLTWPPCTEGVKWLVMKQPLDISRDQGRRFAQLLGRNARLPQPLYLRSIHQTTE